MVFDIIFSAGLYMVFDKILIWFSIRFNIENDIKWMLGGDVILAGVYSLLIVRECMGHSSPPRTAGGARA